MLHATETGISSNRFGPLARVRLYLFFNDKNKNQRFLCNNCALCPGLHEAAKIAIFRVLRKIASLTIFRVSWDFSQFFVMLIITEFQGELSIYISCTIIYWTSTINLTLKCCLATKISKRTPTDNLVFCCCLFSRFFSFSNGVYGLLYKNTVNKRIKSFIKKAHNR